MARSVISAGHRFGKPIPVGWPGGSAAQIAGEGVVVRLAPIKGVTPASALSSRLWFPAIIGDWDLAETALHNEYDTLSGGHFSQPAMGPASARQLRTTSLNTLTVDFDPPWFVAFGQDPYAIRERIGEVLRARKPVHLLMYVTPTRGRRPELDAHVTLRQVTRTLRQGEPDTRYLAVDISEWRDPSVGRRGSSPNRHSRKKGVELPTTHALSATDSLESLARDFYGSYSHWRRIRDANGISKRFGQKTPIVSLPGKWKVGTKIKIPSIGKAAGAL